MNLAVNESLSVQVYEFQSPGSHLSQESQTVTTLEREPVSLSAFLCVKIMPSVVSQAVIRVSPAQKNVCWFCHKLCPLQLVLQLFKGEIILNVGNTEPN